MALAIKGVPEFNCYFSHKRDSLSDDTKNALVGAAGAARLQLRIYVFFGFMTLLSKCSVSRGPFCLELINASARRANQSNDAEVLVHGIIATLVCGVTVWIFFMKNTLVSSIINMILCLSVFTGCMGLFAIGYSQKKNLGAVSYSLPFLFQMTATGIFNILLGIEKLENDSNDQNSYFVASASFFTCLEVVGQFLCWIVLPLKSVETIQFQNRISKYFYTLIFPPALFGYNLGIFATDILVDWNLKTPVRLLIISCYLFARLECSVISFIILKRLHTTGFKSWRLYLHNNGFKKIQDSEESSLIFLWHL